jgi:hypothetical protein
MKDEFKKIIEGVLEDESARQLNLASEACRGELAEKIEEGVKSKFHIFRINKILTGDCGAQKEEK